MMMIMMMMISFARLEAAFGVYKLTRHDETRVDVSHLHCFLFRLVSYLASNLKFYSQPKQSLTISQSGDTLCSYIIFNMIIQLFVRKRKFLYNFKFIRYFLCDASAKLRAYRELFRNIVYTFLCITSN